MRGYIVRRLVYTIVLTLFVIVLNWVIFQAMPGVQGAIAALQGNPRATPQGFITLQNRYGLNASPETRFLNYFWSMLTFNFGNSYNTQHLVLTDMISSGKLANTLLLLGSSTVLSIVIGIFLGVLAARRRGGVVDNVAVTASLTTFSLPTFFMGIIFLSVFAIGLNWFPVGEVVPAGWEVASPPLLQQIIPRLQHLFLPILTLTLFTYGGFLLLTRATMLETLNEDYIVTAKAKGLKERTILFRHALKNASLPLVTASALSFGAILGGAIITETVFSWDGLGRWLFIAIGSKDFPVMQAMFYILALATIIANFISDLVYGIIDPRVRYE
ncbi:ABC transporter permease [Candidatus Bathyarchaeota archaeon]|nr:MAG: ABC transporter permease [Candidatus Bathyarchaeota archaeon]